MLKGDFRFHVSLLVVVLTRQQFASLFCLFFFSIKILLIEDFFCSDYDKECSQKVITQVYLWQDIYMYERPVYEYKSEGQCHYTQISKKI